MSRGTVPLELDLAGVDSGHDWPTSEEEFDRRSGFGVPVNDFVSSQGTMDGSGYFTNLINEGGNIYDWSAVGSQPEYSEQQFGKVEAPVRSNKKRSKNFSMQEDVLFVSAWINISMDAIQDFDQSRASIGWGVI